jgi:hypothetical protein
MTVSSNPGKPANQSGRKRKAGFKGTANWKVLPAAYVGTPSSNQGVDLGEDVQPPTPAIGRESLRNLEPVNYAEPRVKGMPYSMLPGTCSEQLPSVFYRILR